MMYVLRRLETTGETHCGEIAKAQPFPQGELGSYVSMYVSACLGRVGIQYAHREMGTNHSVTPAREYKDVEHALEGAVTSRQLACNGITLATRCGLREPVRFRVAQQRRLQAGLVYEGRTSRRQNRTSLPAWKLRRINFYLIDSKAVHAVYVQSQGSL